MGVEGRQRTAGCSTFPPSTACSPFRENQPRGARLTLPNPSRRLLRLLREQAPQDLQRKKADLKSQIHNGKKQVKDSLVIVNLLYGEAKDIRQNSVPTPTAKKEPGDEAHSRSKFEIQEQVIKLRR